jgi:hypothetical protein
MEKVRIFTPKSTKNFLENEIELLETYFKIKIKKILVIIYKLMVLNLKF